MLCTPILSVGFLFSSSSPPPPLPPPPSPSWDSGGWLAKGPSPWYQGLRQIAVILGSSSLWTALSSTSHWGYQSWWTVARLPPGAPMRLTGNCEHFSLAENFWRYWSSKATERCRAETPLSHRTASACRGCHTARPPQQSPPDRKPVAGPLVFCLEWDQALSQTHSPCSRAAA